MLSQVFRNGHIYQQEYEKGKPLYDVKIVGDTDLTGTRQQFWPDGTIFTTTEYKYDIIAKRMRELAYLNAGITITLTDLRPDEEGNLREPEVFHAKEGLKEFVRFVDRHRTHLFDDVIYLKTEKQGVPIEVAVMYNTDYSENIHSYVNNINTIEGGTHLTGFRMALTRTLKAYADADPQISKQIEKAKIEIAGEDFREGLTAVISIKVAEPQFEGQTKTKLGNSEVAGAVQQAVGEALTNYLEEHPKEAKLICDKVVLAATARIAARKARESVQRKNPMTGGGLPGKLADCSNRDPKTCEIFLVEGDSAGGSAKQGRDRHFQAILPLRGKILNVEKVQWHRVFEAESVMNIIQSIGVRFGVEGEGDREANIDKLRYDKIIIMTDADVDGSHIDTLIMTLFYRFMPQVIQGGHLYIATPPLYKCTYKKVSEYCYTEQQRQMFIDKNAAGDEKSVHTQRYKGLGEMNPEQLWETTMNPENRLLKQVTIENAAEADEIFSMLMGDDVEPRREFIEKNASYANIDA
jgi:DNA gyrase subunit B